MGDFQFLDIVLFAAVALFLVLRLRSVLGKRTGTERRRADTFSAPPAPSTAGRGEPDNVIALPDRPAADLAPGTVAAGIGQIRAAEPRFNEQQFLSGARAAFEMIIGAFAHGDRDTLRPLLSDEVFSNFTHEIDAREKAHERLDNTIVRMRSAELVEARMEGRDALITVKFVSEQINIMRDDKGDALPGQSSEPVEVVDIWTFRRNTRASDPTWTLVATGTAH